MIATLCFKQRSIRPARALSLCLRYGVFAWICLLGAQHALASTLTLDDWDISGFGTLGYANTDKYDDLVLKRNITQRSKKIEDHGWLLDSRIGLQAGKQLDDDWDAVGQILLSERADNSVENAIEMAFLRYRSGNWSAQIGRSILDTFQLSDSRNVGYTYHWVRPPTEFYGWIPFDYYDGFKLIYETGGFEQLWRFEAFYGKTKSTINIGYNDDPSSLNYVKSQPTIGGGITWQKNDLVLRAYMIRYRFSENTAAYQRLIDIADALSAAWPEANEIAGDYAIEDKHLTYGAVGIAWSPGAWIINSELSTINADPFGTYEGERAYIQVGRRFGEFLPHITFSRAWDNRDYPYNDPPVSSPEITALDNAFKDSINSGTVDQYTLSLGLRWDFSSQQAVKFQCDHTTLNRNSLGVLATQDTIDFEIRDFEKDSRTWCSATYDWVF